MKRMILFLADWAKSILFWIIFAVVSFYMVLFGLLYSNSLTQFWSDNKLVLLPLLLCLGILIIVIFKVTTFLKIPGRIVLIYSRDGVPEIYSQPLWGKFDYKIIYCPTVHARKDLISRFFVVKLKLCTNCGTVIIPFSLQLGDDIWLGAATLHEMTVMGGDDRSNGKVFCLQECMQQIFTKNNQRYEKNLEHQAVMLFDPDEDKAPILQFIEDLVFFSRNHFMAGSPVLMLKDRVKIMPLAKEANKV